MNFTSNSSSEHVCSIIASMLRNLKSQQRTRLHNKFTENDCEKVGFRCAPSSLLSSSVLPPLHFFFISCIDFHLIASSESLSSSVFCVWVLLFIVFPSSICYWSRVCCSSWKVKKSLYFILLNWQRCTPHQTVLFDSEDLHTSTSPSSKPGVGNLFG